MLGFGWYAVALHYHTFHEMRCVAAQRGTWQQIVAHTEQPMYELDKV